MKSGDKISLALKTLPPTFGTVDFKQFATLEMRQALFLHDLGRRMSCNLVAYRVPLTSGSRRHLCRIAQTAKLNACQLRKLGASEAKLGRGTAVVAYRVPWRRKPAGELAIKTGV